MSDGVKIDFCTPLPRLQERDSGVEIPITKSVSFNGFLHITVKVYEIFKDICYCLDDFMPAENTLLPSND